MKSYRITLLGLKTGLMICCAAVQASLPNIVVEVQPGEEIKLTRVEQNDVSIDGELTESVWSGLPAYDEFVVIEPDTLVDSTHATRVRIFYDSTGLYFGIEMDQPADTLIARLSGRDKRELNRDSINLTLDTSGEGRYGFWFGLNLGGAIQDGTVLPERQFSSDWDGPWRAESYVTESGWSAEFHIPWGAVSMPRSDKVRRIGLYMSRKVAYVDERYGWPALPRTKPKFISELQPLTVTGIDPKQQYSIYPYSSVTRDRVEGRTDYEIGADFFWRPSTNFQLNATINPDFGAVESDEVVINLSATETFFPEKRLFFLEGQEIFVTSPRADTRGGGVGNRGAPTTLINTRRIGGQPLAPPAQPGVVIPDRELRQPVDLIGALKATGQSGSVRYGLLAAFEDDVKFDATLDGQPVNLPGESSDYGAFRVLYENSDGGAYKAVGAMTTATMNPLRDAMTHGLDGHYLSEDGKLKFDGQFYLSDIEDEETGMGGFLDFEYTFRRGVVQGLGIEYVDEHADLNDLGFLQRNDRMSVRTRHTRTRSDLSWARDNQFDVRGFVQKNADNLFTGGGIFFSNRTTFNNLNRLTLRAGFQPTFYDDLNSFGNGAYRVEPTYTTTFVWESDSSKPFKLDVGGGFFKEQLGGDTWRVRVGGSWRPSDRFSISGFVRYSDQKGWLLHQEDVNFTTFDAQTWQPQLAVDYFISGKQQFKFSFQWVGIKAKEDEFFLVPDSPGDLIPVPKPPGPSDSFSLSQMSMQLRYRWEIAPLSDLFVVYTRLVDQGSPLKSFSDTFQDGYHNPLGDFLVVKLRYRFGS